MKPASAKVSYLRPFNKYRQAKTPEDYLDQRLDKSGDCWLWTRGVDKDGYGQCQSSRVAKEISVSRSHQMAYIAWVGEIPDGYFVCHKCDNPTCCNPEHLFVGTALDNNRDMINKGRQCYPKTSKYDRDYIVSQHGIKDCMELSKEVGCSYSYVCLVWRKKGLSGKNWHGGRKLDTAE